MQSSLLVSLVVPVLLVLGACSPAPPTDPPGRPDRPDRPEPTASARPAAWLAGVPAGPPPRVAHVVGDVVVGPDGVRTGLRRSRRDAVGVQDFTVLADGSLLVQDADNFEGYTTLRLVRDGRTVTTWSTTGFVVGPGGTAAFGEATSSEAVPTGPTAVHLLDGSRHASQPAPFHPSVLAVVDGRVAYRRRSGLSGPPGVLVTDLVGPPELYAGAPLSPELGHVADGPVPAGSRVLDHAREPSGAVLLLVAQRGRGDLTALLRRRVDGVLEVAAPPLRRPRGAATSAYTLPAQAG